MALRMGAVLQDRYRIEQLLGKGGFGAVYRAFDREKRQTVAVKENLDSSPEAQRQFVREAEVLQILRHAHLPRVKTHFVVPGRGQYLIMDFIEGEDLESRVQRRGAIPYKQASRWIGQIAGALAYLHSRTPPVIHRDIKPANIRITDNGEAILVDFGLVKLYEPSKKTTKGARAVTPGFSPPEQYGQGETDARSDVYALSATLYMLITGRTPPESMSRLMGRPVRPAHQVNVHVPLAISGVLEKGMVLDPAGRYQTATEFQNALSEALKTEPKAKPKRKLEPELSPPSERLEVVSELTPEPEPAEGLPPPVPSPAPEKSSQSEKPIVAKPSRNIGLGTQFLIFAGVVLLVGALFVLFTDDNSGNPAGSPTSTLIPTPTATVPPTPNFPATQTAQSMQALITSVQGGQRVLSPRSGTLRSAQLSDLTDCLQPPTDDFVADQCYGLEGADRTDFVAQASFINPASANWDYGFIFRFDPTVPTAYRLIVDWESQWQLTLNGERVDSGMLETLNTASGQLNSMQLTVVQGQGWLVVNGFEIVQLDLAGYIERGAVIIATGLNGGVDPAGNILIRDFTFSDIR